MAGAKLVKRDTGFKDSRTDSSMRGKRSRPNALGILMLLMCGCAATGIPEYGVKDPVEPVNRVSYTVLDGVDRVLVRPIARGYERVTPEPLSHGISNFFANIRTIDSAVSAFLQLKPMAGLKDTGRIVVNTTLGIGGLIDVASRLGIEAQNEDFGQTLAHWGYTRSSYLFLPLGPTTVRDLPGDAVDKIVLPRWVLGSLYGIGFALLDTIDSRAETLDETEAMEESALDPYSFIRDAYYQQRRFLIFDGNPPPEVLDDLYEEF